MSRSELMGLAQDIVGKFPDIMRGFQEFLDRCESLELDIDVRAMGRVSALRAAFRPVPRHSCLACCCLAFGYKPKAGNNIRIPMCSCAPNVAPVPGHIEPRT